MRFFIDEFYFVCWCVSFSFSLFFGCSVIVMCGLGVCGFVGFILKCCSISVVISVIFSMVKCWLR